MARSRRASSACLGGKHARATRLQWACLPTVSTSAFHRRNRARRETTIRPSISRNDADVTEMGRRGVSPDGAVPPVFFPRGGARGLAVFGRRVGLVQDGVEVLARGGVVLGDAAAAVGEEDAELERAPAVADGERRGGAARAPRACPARRRLRVGGRARGRRRARARRDGPEREPRRRRSAGALPRSAAAPPETAGVRAGRRRGPWTACARRCRPRGRRRPPRGARRPAAPCGGRLRGRSRK